jgi:hypothetical protein
MKGGGVVQATECLLCECEALSSNPSPTKKKNKRLPEINKINKG